MTRARKHWWQRRRPHPKRRPPSSSSRPRTRVRCSNTRSMRSRKISAWYSCCAWSKASTCARRRKAWKSTRRRCARDCFARSASCARISHSVCAAKAPGSSTSGRSVATTWSRGCWRDYRTSDRGSLRGELFERDHGRPFDGLQHDGRGHVAHAAHAQQTAHREIRECLDVAHDDVEQEIHLAGHRVAGQYLGPVDQRAPEAL